MMMPRSRRELSPLVRTAATAVVYVQLACMVRHAPGVPLPMADPSAGPMGLWGDVSQDRATRPQRVVCVGDSMTEGVGGDGATYPAYLAGLLGDQYQVANFGVSSRGLLNSGDLPYRAHPFYAMTLASDADHIVVMLGTNDAKVTNWNVTAFGPQYAEMIADFQAMPSNPSIWLVLPPPLYPEVWGFQPSVINDLLPGHGPAGVRTIAAEAGLAPPIDVFSMFDTHCPVQAGGTSCDWISDPIHPNQNGYMHIAEAAKAAILGHRASAPPTPSPTPSPIPAPTSWLTGWLLDHGQCPQGYEDHGVRHSRGLGKIVQVSSHMQCASRCSRYAGVQYAGGCKSYQTGMYYGMMLCRSCKGLPEIVCSRLISEAKGGTYGPARLVAPMHLCTGSVVD